MVQRRQQRVSRELPCVIVGAGAAGIGVARALQEVGVSALILERHEIGGSFRRWPREMRFITPSFPSNSFGTLDLNSVAIGTSPAFTLECEHPTGKQYADYLKSVVEYFHLLVQTGVDVKSLKPRAGGGFELETSSGRLKASTVIWAAGEFQYPKLRPFPGAEHGVHNSRVKSWKRLAGDDAIIIGGYESGIDAAVHLANAGKRVRVLERNSVWSTDASDPSITLSPFTWDRLMETPDGRIEMIDEVEIERIEKQRGGYAVIDVSGQRWLTKRRPILATGFEGSPALIRDLFDWRDDGFPLLSSIDESTRAPGLFLVGSLVRHERLVFCFIYKFRQRFGVVAHEIGQRLGHDTAALQKYRFWGMYLDDLTCCGSECVC
ncbi:MAG: NAD(P)-binding domain-containing protein [Planctomycetaceae bacterium]|nr:NAD(P)-binding domain-containing protein [Planctomycetaceae bacterium]